LEPGPESTVVVVVYAHKRDGVRGLLPHSDVYDLLDDRVSFSVVQLCEGELPNPLGEPPFGRV